jgi:hypothetical protein
MKTVELAPFGIALREAIDESPFKNRSAFLAAAGTQPPVLYRYETGEQSPRLDQIAEWAALLGCAPERLIPFVKRSEAREDTRDVARDPDLLEFLATDLGSQTTTEERETLALLSARHGRPRGLETYYSLISLLRTGFIDATALSHTNAARSGAPEGKRSPESDDRVARPKAKKKGTAER